MSAHGSNQTCKMRVTTTSMPYAGARLELPRALARCALSALRVSFLLILMAELGACRWFGGDAPSWQSDGDELGRRVREGELPGVEYRRFRSKTLERDVGVVIATPPGYADYPERRYPVVYVFPGIGGNEWTYLQSVGLHNSAVRALFADPAAAPLLVFANPGDSATGGTMESVLGRELVAFVDDGYRTRRDAAARSLEGFSLGGVMALTLAARLPGTFGRAVGLSSACYLLPNCEALQKALLDMATSNQGRVLLAVGARENEKNRALNQKLARSLGSPLLEIPDADHDWKAQLETPMGEHRFGERVAQFHLSGSDGVR